MMLAIYGDHPWANRDRAPMSDLAGEIADAGRWATVCAGSGDGVLFLKRERMKIPISATSLANAAQHAAAGSGNINYPALRIAGA